MLIFSCFKSFEAIPNNLQTENNVSETGDHIVTITFLYVSWLALFSSETVDISMNSMIYILSVIIPFTVNSKPLLLEWN